MTEEIETNNQFTVIDLGTEAIHRFTVKDFPAIVLMDAHGGNLYESGPAEYREDNP